MILSICYDKNSTILCILLLQAFIQFPGAKTAQENQEYVVLRLLDSLKTLSLLATGDESSFTDIIKAEPGVLAVCFKNFKVSC